MRARSTAASVWPARRNTPPSFARNGNTCPGCTRSSGVDFGFAIVLIVAARSCALMPVVTPVAASTETVKSVRYISRFCATIRCRPSCSARSFEIGTQIKPRPCIAMKLMAFGVAFSAAMTRSPSFSRSASSVTITILPAAISRTTSSIVSNSRVTGTSAIIRLPSLPPRSWASAYDLGNRCRGGRVAREVPG